MQLRRIPVVKICHVQVALCIDDTGRHDRGNTIVRRNRRFRKDNNFRGNCRTAVPVVQSRVDPHHGPFVGSQRITTEDHSDFISRAYAYGRILCVMTVIESQDGFINECCAGNAVQHLIE